MDYEGRLKRLRDSLETQEVDGLYVGNLTNVRYLCGFTGSAGHLLVSGRGFKFLSDERYRIQAGEQVQGAGVEIYRIADEMGPALGKAAKDLGISKLGFEGDHVSVTESKRLEEYFDGMPLTPAAGLVEALRRVKEPDEIQLMREAARFADAGLAYILERVEVGKTEREIGLDLEFFMRSQGADAVSFDLIVAAAERSALPHAYPTRREVEKGRYLLFDLGCKAGGYCSDLTRTVMVGPPDDRHRDTYDLVLRANQAGIAAIRSGSAASEVDYAARNVIAEAGRGEAFGHGLGHGVGLEIHESPALRATSKDVLQAGDVVTVEPGVYFRGWGGVRIEDLVLVTDQGSEVLSAAPKDLLVL